MSNVLASLLVELGINTAAFAGGLDKATYQAKASAKEMGHAFEGLGRDISGVLSLFGDMGSVVGEAFEGIGNAMSKSSSMMGGVGVSASGAAVALAGLGAAALTTAAAIGGLAMEGGELVHHLDEVRQKTGMSISDLQTLQAAGSTVGVSLDAMVMAFRRFDQALVGTGRASGQTQVVLRSLGVTSKDNKEALMQAADGFAKMEDGPRKAADAVALFSRTGLNMIPFLNKGRAGLLEFEEIVDQYGPKIGRDAVAANEAYLMSQLKLSLSWDSVKVAAVPALGIMSDWITKMATATTATLSFIEKLIALGGATRDYWAEAGKHGMTLPFAGGLLPQLSEDELGKAGLKKPAPKPDSPEQAQAKATAAALKAKADAYDLATAAAQKNFDLVKQGGKAGAALAEAQKDINADLLLGGKDNLNDAAALQAKIPLLERQAKLEKERTQLSVYTPKIAPVADMAGDMEAKTQSQIARQIALAGAVNTTKASTTSLNAQEEAKNAILDKQIGLADELVKVQGELRVEESPTRRNALEQRVAQIEQLSASLNRETPKIIAQYQELATGKSINAAGSGLDATIVQLKAQRDAILETGRAYEQGSEAIRSAAIDKALEKERIQVEQATLDYKNFAAANGNSAQGLAAYANAVDQANLKLQSAKIIQGQIYDNDIANQIQVQTDALAGETKAWEIETAAIGKNREARIQAAMDAARAKATSDKKTPGQVDFAGQQAGTKEAQSIDSGTAHAVDEEQRAIAQDAASWQILNEAIGENSEAQIAAAGAAARVRAALDPSKTVEQIKLAGQAAEQNEAQSIAGSAKQAGSQMDLLSAYDRQIEKLEQIKLLYNGNATVELKANAAELDARQQLNTEWDDAALKVGTLSQKWTAFLDKMQQAGSANQLGQDLFTNMQQGLNKLNESLANFIVTGKGGFRQLGLSILTDFINMGIRGLEQLLAKQLATIATTAAAKAAARAADQAGQASEHAIDSISQIAKAKLAAAGAASAVAGVPIIGPALAVAAYATVFAATAMEEGGPVQAGRQYLVGEKRPEIFTPQSSGRITPRVPSGFGTGGNGDTHFHFSPVVHAVDADGVRGMLQEHGPIFAEEMTRQLRARNSN